MTVADIVTRLLAFPNLTTADTLPAGTKELLVDAIGGAISDMADAAPRYFETRLAGAFSAPVTVSVTIDASLANTLAAATSGILKVLGTLRIPGGTQDFQVVTYSHPTATIAPGWNGALGAVATATTYHDAVAVSSAIHVDASTVVEVAGVELQRVATRQDAFELCGQDRQGVSLDTGTASDAAPAVWWEERTDTASYVCIYPLPAVRMSYTIRGVRAIAQITASGVLTDTTTFGLEESVARDIWLPLAVQRWASSPLMVAIQQKEEIARQGAEAIARLGALSPKQRKLEPWNSRKVLRRW